MSHTIELRENGSLNKSIVSKHMHAIIIMFEITISRFSMNWYKHVVVVVTIVLDSGNTRKPINFAKTTFGSGEHPKWC